MIIYQKYFSVRSKIPTEKVRIQVQKVIVTSTEFQNKIKENLFDYESSVKRNYITRNIRIKTSSRHSNRKVIKNNDLNFLRDTVQAQSENCTPVKSDRLSDFAAKFSDLTKIIQENNRKYFGTANKITNYVKLPQSKHEKFLEVHKKMRTQKYSSNNRPPEIFKARKRIQNFFSKDAEIYENSALVIQVIKPNKGFQEKAFTSTFSNDEMQRRLTAYSSYRSKKHRLVRVKNI